MKIGYARVSTDDQTLDSQLDALRIAGCETVYQEHASGASADRPQLDACLKALRPGDALVVWRLDRLGRSLINLVSVVNDLKSRGIQFDSLTERIDTTSPSGELIFHLFASMAQFERNLIRERTMAGLKAARARGRKGGRRRKLTANDLKAVRAMMQTGELTVREIAHRFGVSTATLYRNVGAVPISPPSLQQNTPAG